MSVDTILLYTIFAGILSIVYGFVTGSSILNASAGNAKMQEIASAIQVGAKAFAPTWIAEAISCIFAFPALAFKIDDPVTNPYTMDNIPAKIVYNKMVSTDI